MVKDRLRQWAANWNNTDGSLETSLEIQILREAERFRSLAALAWSEETIYPKNEYVAGRPDGQCGVTNYGFGIWLSRRGLAYSTQLFFEEGKIVNATGSLVGGNHTWLRIEGIEEIDVQPKPGPMRFDLAGDQFDGIDAPVIIQYDDYFYPDPKTAGGNCVYRFDSRTPFMDYDTDRFKGRLDRFMNNINNVSANF
ncbi:MAG TPA: hypothetical protein VF733_00475 [Candidatus Saccharimonadales bacterium]